MNPSNRAKLQVERLEDRCTPSGFHLSIAQIAQLVTAHVSNPLPKLQRIEDRLQRIEDKAIARGAPQAVLQQIQHWQNVIDKLQARLAP